jgi:M6 family metalloprotease-like protein
MTIPHPGHGPASGGAHVLPRPLWQQRIDQAKALKRQMAAMPGLAGAPPQAHTTGDCLGLCLPVDFPDVPSRITVDEIDAFCNQPGYSGFGNNGSVFDYFLDNSAGKLRYKTLVAPCYTAQKPRAHYTDEAIPQGRRSAELVREAVLHHLAHGFDFSRLSVDPAQAIRAANLLYAGPVVNGFAKGLWPHASSVPGGVAAGGGRSVADYQVSAMADALTLGVYCHENGHMLCDFPDLYQFGGVRAGCGSYCLMSFGAVADERNPPQIGAYLKYKAGWAMPQSIGPGESFTAAASGNRCFMLQKSPTEYFLIEYRRRAGRDAALPGEGLAVWHIDELGSNTDPQSGDAAHRHYECALVQADGRNDLEGVNDGDESDLFGPTAHSVFPPHAKPSSLWWDGSVSGLQISAIRPVAGGLEFTVA